MDFETKHMKMRALTDLAIVGFIFWGIWALQFFGIKNAGLAVPASAVTAAIIILMRKESWRDFGFRMPPSISWTLARVGEFAFITFAAGVGVFAILNWAGHAPSPSAVLENQPDTLFPFLIDLVVGGWISAGIGEEFLFRGFLLMKFHKAFGGGRHALLFAVLAQALWFGFAHTSQGVSGMLAISFLAVFLGGFYVTRAQRIIIPLMIGHALVDTISLTSNYLS